MGVFSGRDIRRDMIKISFLVFGARPNIIYLFYHTFDAKSDMIENYPIPCLM